MPSPSVPRNHAEQHNGSWVSQHNSSPYTSQLDPHQSESPTRPFELTNTQLRPMPFLAAAAATTTFDSGHARQGRQLPRISDILSPNPRPDLSSSPSRWTAAGHPPDWSQPAMPARPSPTSASSYADPWLQNVINPRPSYQPHPMESTLQHSYGAHSHLPQQSFTTGSAIAPPQHHPAQVQPCPFPLHTDSRMMISIPPQPTTESAGADRRRDSARSGVSGALSTSECVGQRQIPGKGLCYVYKDGNTCPTVIDGEVVNPMWGTTKAGKARKRLAMACLNCREKKIRCEPRQPKCVQCAKSKRECQMPPMNLQQPDTPGSLGTTLPNLSPAHPPSVMPENTLGSDFSSAPSPKRKRSEGFRILSYAGSTAPSEARSFERSFSAPDDAQPTVRSTTITSSKLDMTHLGRSEDMNVVASIGESQPEHLDPQTWDVDPYEVDPEETMQLLNVFFSRETSTDHLIYPRASFIRWVTTRRDKCQNERMVLQCILTLASAFSDSTSLFAKHCVERACQSVASKFGKYSLPLVQARFFLGYYNHVKGRDQLAWDYGGTALRAASATGLHTEDGCAMDKEHSYRNYFDLTNQQLIEMRRRTFWSGFSMDRATAFCSGSLYELRTQAIHLRLPCSEETYENSLPSNAPFFDNSIIDKRLTIITPACDLSPRAFSIVTYQLWLDVTNFVHAGVRHAPSAYAQKYETFFADTHNRIASWQNSLPHRLRYSKENLQAALRNGGAGEMLTMHSTIHSAMVEAARYVQHKVLSRAVIHRNIFTAYHHARTLLLMLRELCESLHLLPEGKDVQSLFFSWHGFTVISAIDAVTAGGNSADLDDTIANVTSGRDILRILARQWPTAKRQLRVAEKRVDELEAIRHDIHYRHSRDSGSGVLENRPWRLDSPMDEFFDRPYDVLYGIDNETFLEGLRDVNVGSTGTAFSSGHQ